MRKYSFSLFFFLFSFLYCEERNLIESVKVGKNMIEVVPNKELSEYFMIKEFLLQYDDPSLNLTKLDYSIVTLPFLLHVVPIIWQQDITYIVERMDKDLYESLEKIKKVFRLFYKNINWCGSIKPLKLVENSYTNSPEFSENSQAVIIPFSGGVDSIYNSLATLDKKQYLITICGGDVPLYKKDLWQEVKKHCYDYAEQYRVPIATVRSNFAGIYNGEHNINHPAMWTYTTQGLGYTSLMLPVMVAKGIPFCLLGSASVVDFPWPYGSHPLIEHNLKVAGCHTFHFGGELTRSEKLGAIVNICEKNLLKKPNLRVCWSSENGQNCCACFHKCIVTMMCLLVEGQDYHEFGFSLPFDQMVLRLKGYFTKKNFDDETIWKWRFVQRRIREIKDKNIQYTSEVQNLILWFEQLELDSLRDPNKPIKYSQEVKSFFCSLWTESMDIAHNRFASLFG